MHRIHLIEARPRLLYLDPASLQVLGAHLRQSQYSPTVGLHRLRGYSLRLVTRATYHSLASLQLSETVQQEAVKWASSTHHDEYQPRCQVASKSPGCNNHNITIDGILHFRVHQPARRKLYPRKSAFHRRLSLILALRSISRPYHCLSPLSLADAVHLRSTRHRSRGGSSSLIAGCKRGHLTLSRTSFSVLLFLRGLKSQLCPAFSLSPQPERQMRLDFPLCPTMPSPEAHTNDPTMS